jgi:hypothetical protein
MIDLGFVRTVRKRVIADSATAEGTDQERINKKTIQPETHLDSVVPMCSFTSWSGCASSIADPLFFWILVWH